MRPDRIQVVENCHLCGDEVGPREGFRVIGGGLPYIQPMRLCRRCGKAYNERVRQERQSTAKLYLLAAILPIVLLAVMTVAGVLMAVAKTILELTR